MVPSHGSTLEEDELQAIKDAGAAISSTPDTELQMSMGRPAAFAADRHGCTVSIGIDICLNNPADMFGQMRLMLQNQRYMKIGNSPPPPKKLSARCEDVLRIATFWEVPKLLASPISQAPLRLESVLILSSQDVTRIDSGRCTTL